MSHVKVSLLFSVSVCFFGLVWLFYSPRKNWLFLFFKILTFSFEWHLSSLEFPAFYWGVCFLLKWIRYYFPLPAPVNWVIYNFVRFIYLSKAPNLSSSHSFKQQKRPKKKTLKDSSALTKKLPVQSTKFKLPVKTENSLRCRPQWLRKATSSSWPCQKHLDF